MTFGSSKNSSLVCKGVTKPRTYDIANVQQLRFWRWIPLFIWRMYSSKLLIMRQ